ncbi:hypothetical protein LTR28_007148 [Elasticomyces elasticus]|nr:hypothetical protein LTR50_007084 [Elasticomyces elasticus]KAK5010883.1 hypothetical protein LTR28_007148 [Elasticomyces elasticus]
MSAEQLKPHAPTSRPRPAPQGDEEASARLNLGPEFSNVPSLTLSEARAVICAVVDHRKKTNRMALDAERRICLVCKRCADAGIQVDSDTLSKTQEYLEHFARFKEPTAVEAVERLLAGRSELARWERSQIGSLCPDTAEEARVLIPSLIGKMPEEELQDLLDEITKLRQFGE